MLRDFTTAPPFFFAHKFDGMEYWDRVSQLQSCSSFHTEKSHFFEKIMGDIAFNRMIEMEQEKISKLERQLAVTIRSAEQLDDKREADERRAEQLGDSIEELMDELIKRKETLRKEKRIRRRIRYGPRFIVPYGEKCGNKCNTVYHRTRNANWQRCDRCRNAYICVKCFFYDDFVLCKSCAAEQPPASP